MSNLVVCCDGTWDTLDQKDHGVPTPSNVAKLYNATIKDAEQSVYYHPGVGTDGHFVDKIVGGSTGDGLDRNIKSAYAWLAHHYTKGDRIFLFGFSRGAYTVRSLGGLMAHCGLIDISSTALTRTEAWTRVDTVFDSYRKRKPFNNRQGYAFHNVRPGQPCADTTPIHFLGVWDTVGALGIPVEFAVLRQFDGRKQHEFHDTALGRKVANARHAVALDERRGDFMPTLWSNVARRKSVKQVWFPGVHGDVGGGYVQTGLSDGALRWMLHEAEACGLRIRDGADAQLRPDPMDVLHDSRSGIYKVGRTLPRQVVRIDPSSVDNGSLHASALQRQANPPITQGPYWPTTVLQKGASTTINVYAAQKWNATGVFLQRGKRYRMIASGQWLDAGVKFSAAGGELDGPHISDLARLSSSVLGLMEKGFNALTHRHSDFALTRRDESAPWLALIGYVANGFKPDIDDRTSGQTFVIGEDSEFTPAADGYLYAFANDAWQTYANNHGSVELHIEAL